MYFSLKLHKYVLFTKAIGQFSDSVTALNHIRDKSRGSRDFIPIKGSTNDALILTARYSRYTLYLTTDVKC